ncbi:MAG: hypothetical protein AB7K24_01890 [Gemmataceae bacterium]
MKRIHVAIGVATLIVTAAAGCSGGRGPTVQVSGKVTLDGEPLPHGAIWFTSPRSGAGFTANIQPDGTYSVQVLDVKMGETYGVHLGGREPAPGEPVKLDGVGNLEIAMPGVPPRYFESTTSGLTAVIASSSPQTFDFDLNSRE